MAEPGPPASGQPARIRDLLNTATATLGPCSDSPRLDAELLLAHALHCPRSSLHAWPEREVAAEAVARFHALLSRRQGGEPLAYLIGEREFWSLNLKVGPGVLVPRPETERLVELTLALELPGGAWVADLGTGSGAIAAALAHERPDLRIVAVERSAAALRLSRANLQRLAGGRVGLIHGDWCAPLAPGRFDALVGNPPYVAADDPHLAGDGLTHEPREALASGADGLRDLNKIIEQAAEVLRPGGWLLLEHGPDQGGEVTRMFEAAGYLEVRDEQDLEGRARVGLGRRPPRP
jgi:release factor glutamine methyltransferase